MSARSASIMIRTTLYGRTGAGAVAAATLAEGSALVAAGTLAAEATVVASGSGLREQAASTSRLPRVMKRRSMGGRSLLSPAARALLGRSMSDAAWPRAARSAKIRRMLERLAIQGISILED